MYAEYLKDHVKIKTQQQQGDLNLIASRMMGVRNLNELTRDINRNPLITGSITNMLSSSSITNEGSTPIEIFGASLYAKCGNYLGFVALICEIFTHMDWARFIELSKKQQSSTTISDEPVEISTKSYDIIND